ncbi:ABC Superfamily [Phytophthora palmivora]|uniref:ABC Superfamily n=1 Tax=Phytophthora palmivora TaxID=4796 RepID=A0A2P4YQ36_9STRA|nr:ABC Superfamily [Phytophthora palmivora]
MPKKASTHGASAPSKSKTARSKTAKAKSKDKAAPRKEARKAPSEAASKPTAAAAKQGEGPRHSRSRSLSPDNRPNPRFGYRDHSLGDAPVDDTATSEAKAALTSSPAKNLTLSEAPDSPPREAGFSKDYHSLFDSCLDEAEEEGAVTEPQEISNDLNEQQERCQAAQQQGASEVASSAPPTPAYPRGYYPPDAGFGSPMFLEHLKAPRGLNHGRKSRGAYERALAQDEPLFVNDIEAARCVLLAPHRIPLKEFTSLRKKPEDRGGLFPVWGYPWELKELREDRLLSYVLDQRDLRIEFAHLVAKRQLHSVMEGLRQQSKSSAQDERGYGSVNPGTVHLNPEPVFRLPRVL